MHGKGVLIRRSDSLGLDGDWKHPIIGFYTTRVVRAATHEDAGPAAMAIVAAEWQAAPYKNCNEGSAPELEVEKIIPNNFLQARRQPLKGYTFYAASDDDLVN